MWRGASYFPSGAPGFGLLLLRLVLAVGLSPSAIDTISSTLLATNIHPDAAVAAAAISLLAAMFAACGFLSPIAQSVVLVLAGMNMVAGTTTMLPALVSNAPWERALLEAAIAGALILTGPGAYSADARLFGARQVFIPPRG